MFENNGDRNARRRKSSRAYVAKKQSKKGIDKVTIIGFIALVVVIGGIFGINAIIQSNAQAEKDRQAKENAQILAGALPEGTIATVGDLKIDTSAYAVMYFENKSKKDQEKSFTDAAAASNFWKTSTLDYNGKTVSAMEWLKQTTLDQARQFALHIDYINKTPFNTDKTPFKLTDEQNKAFETSYTQNLESNFGKQTDYTKPINTYLHVKADAYKNYMQRNYLISTYQQEALAKTLKTITVKATKDYFDKNKKTLKLTDKVQHILFKTQDAAGKDIKGAKFDAIKKEAYRILAEAKKSGVDYNKLVLQYSQDNPTAIKQNKGIYEVTQDAQLVPEFKNWALSHKTGDIGIVKTTYGFHIMKQISSSKDVPTYVGMKSTIKDTLAQTDLNNKLQTYFQDKPKALINDDVFVMIANIVIMS